jgi:uncharacterized protein YfiM (DUF2279 family)
MLLSSFLASHSSSSRSLLGILVISLFCNTKLKAQNIPDSLITPASDTVESVDNPENLKAYLQKHGDRNLNYYTLTPKQKKTRTWLVTGANVVGYGGVMTALASAWYDDYTKTKLHSFNDSKEWLQVDKVGHFYGTWIESRANNEMWKWTGMERKKRIWISGLTSFAFQTTIEYLDGRSAEWGWSWADFGANILGSGTFVAQELAWDEQRIKLKWSFHRKNYKDASLNQRSNELFGKSSPERFLKDYNGQTYWASASLKSFFPKSKLPGWLCVSLGYGAEGMFGGEENIAKDTGGNITFDRRDIKRYRQWYFAPDIDLSKIKTNSKVLNFVFLVLSAFKFPAPSLEFSNGKFRANAIHF